MTVQSVNLSPLPASGQLQHAPTADTPLASRPTPAAVAAAEAKPAQRDLEEMVKKANDFIQPFNNALQFSIDKDTGTTIVKVIDIGTKEVIKQIPSEEMLGLTKALDQLKGLLVKQQA